MLYLRILKLENTIECFHSFGHLVGIVTKFVNTLQHCLTSDNANGKRSIVT
jgi:hypothetical protein